MRFALDLDDLLVHLLVPQLSDSPRILVQSLADRPDIVPLLRFLTLLHRNDLAAQDGMQYPMLLGSIFEYIIIII